MGVALSEAVFVSSASVGAAMSTLVYVHVCACLLRGASYENVHACVRMSTLSIAWGQLLVRSMYMCAHIYCLGPAMSTYVHVCACLLLGASYEYVCACVRMSIAWGQL